MSSETAPQNRQVLAINELTILLDAQRKDVVQAPTATTTAQRRTALQHDFYRLVVTLQAQERRDAIRLAGDAFGLTRTTAYRWARDWANNGAGQGHRSDSGTTKFASEVEKLVQNTIQHAVADQKAISITALWHDINNALIDLGLPTISRSTLGRRINDLPSSDRMVLKRGRKALELLQPTSKGETGKLPLDLVEIDHWMVDIILVSEIDRTPLGVAYLTVLLDTATRVVLGYYLSHDFPNLSSVGRACMQAFFPKDEVLNKLGVQGQWPCWGKPKKIRPDNAREFESDVFKELAIKHGFVLAPARRRRPKDKAKIESFFGTLSGYFKYLPGSTKIKPGTKGSGSVGPSLTLAEFEKIFVDYIVNKYHRSVHETLQTTPLKQYERSIKLVHDLSLPVSQVEFLIDILPQVTNGRVVKPEGVTVNNIMYWNDSLIPLIGDGRKYNIKYDPDDLTAVWLAQGETYIRLSYRDPGYPAISLAQYKQYQARRRNENKDPSDVEAIMSHHRRTKEQIETGEKLTKEARITRKKEGKSSDASTRESTVKVTDKTRSEWMNEARNLTEDNDQ
ncbi:Mu transposase C-terminal domain-containing protein [uncultured Deinococcus sp.]|uniref:Mu transposase C-terminal domain-containing protein n=1 Tax=uncultured Deinococcus sp. TaxID=158789 RepID=UPI0025FE88E6|nr:Mu transposase C-terminal domain-containing protein [uncultured Deinococcus sp.]